MHRGAKPRDELGPCFYLTRHLQVARVLLADHTQQNGGLRTLLRCHGMALSRVWFRGTSETNLRVLAAVQTTNEPGGTPCAWTSFGALVVHSCGDSTWMKEEMNKHRKQEI